MINEIGYDAVESLTDGDVYELNLKEIKKNHSNTVKNLNLLKQAKSSFITWKQFFDQFDKDDKLDSDHILKEEIEEKTKKDNEKIEKIEKGKRKNNFKKKDDETNVIN